MRRFARSAVRAVAIEKANVRECWALVYIQTSPLSMDTPDEGALCEVMLEILTRENLATQLS